LIVLHKRQKSPQPLHILLIKKFFLNALRLNALYDWRRFRICAKFTAVKTIIRPLPGRSRINQQQQAQRIDGTILLHGHNVGIDF
jgi:hypothetical protein